MTGISVAARKAKGRKLQQLVRDAILSRYPTLEPDDVRSTPMGVNGTDIQLSPAAKAEFPFSIECKARAKIGLIYDAIDQAEDLLGTTKIAVVKADRKRPLAVIDLEDLLDLIEQAK